MFESRKQEKAFLIGIVTDRRSMADFEESFEELKALAYTAGVLKGGEAVIPLREKINPATFIGQGRIQSLKNEIKNNGADLVIFNAELSPTQARNLENEWSVRVIDRTGLILDIFALQAKSKEGKLQVELAQYQYLLPRLVGSWTHFSKQRGGGVGLRGPGETQLEVDRRRIRDRIYWIKKELKKVSSSREIHRKKRDDVPIPTVALVGYTNAGKSTLFNALGVSSSLGSLQLTEDKLFATLDPKTKRVKLPSGRDILVSDTVGFIKNLPHQLIEAFKSTFEETQSSHLLIHVIDGSSPHYRHQMEVVNRVLEELSLNHVALIQVMNKMDLETFYYNGNGPLTTAVSAKNKTGLGPLLHLIDETLSHADSAVKLFIPHPYGGLLSSLYSHGRILNLTNKVRGIFVEVALSEKWQRKFAPYAV